MKDKAVNRKQQKKRKQNTPNRKHLNNKILKAKEILSKNSEALRNDTADTAHRKRMFRRIRRIFFWVNLTVIALLLVSFLFVRIKGDTPTVFGYSIQRISTGSMEPELLVGDTILSHSIKSPEEVAVGDIITFSSAEYAGRSVTHRVLTAPAKNEHGEYRLTTKGDANPVEDKEIAFSAVRSKMVKKLSFLNKLYNLFLSPAGLLILIALLVIIYFDEILTIAKVLTGNYDETKEEDYEEVMAAERAKAEQLRREEERRERKRRNPRKYDNTSSRKKKRQNQRQKQAKADSKAVPVKNEAVSTAGKHMKK